MNPQDGRVVSNFIVQALKNEDLTVYGSGQQTRSFCYVDDLIEGMVRMMECEGFMGPVNLGNPAELVIRLTGSRSKIVHLPLPADDPVQRKPVIRLAEERLAWVPSVTLEQGLLQTIEYFKSVV